jgi:hypothetical protein
MAELDTKDRNRLLDRSFAWIDKDGERHLPISADPTSSREKRRRSAPASSCSPGRAKAISSRRPRR